VYEREQEVAMAAKRNTINSSSFRAEKKRLLTLGNKSTKGNGDDL
jgi:hypothetical protein